MRGSFVFRVVVSQNPKESPSGEQSRLASCTSLIQSLHDDMLLCRFVYDMGSSKAFQPPSTVEELMNVILITDRFEIDWPAERAVHRLL